MPATSIKEVIEKMDTLLASWESQEDYRAIFVSSYRIITIGMERAIAAGEFEDPEWMTRLDIIFAEEYFTAIDAYDRGEGHLPECWQRVFNIAVEKRGSTLQDLTLGMASHIIHDLPIALYKAGIELGRRDSRLHDHEVANDVLARSINEVQQEISSQYSFILGFLDKLFGNKDEILTDSGIRMARDSAWKCAVALADAPNDMTREVRLRELAQAAMITTQLLAPKTPFLFAPFIRRWDRALARWIR